MLIRCKKIYAVIRLAYRLRLGSISTPLDDPLDDRPGDRQLNPNESEPYKLRYNYLQ